MKLFNKFKKYIAASLAVVVSLVAPSVVHAYALTALDVQPIADGITANVTILMPIMLGVMATVVGAIIVFKLVRKFTSGAA